MEQKDKGEKASCFGMGVKTPMEECSGNGAAAETTVHGNRRSNIFRLLDKKTQHGYSDFAFG